MCLIGNSRAFGDRIYKRGIKLRIESKTGEGSSVRVLQRGFDSRGERQQECKNGYRLFTDRCRGGCKGYQKGLCPAFRRNPSGGKARRISEAL